jgi:hypothetical protein
MFFLINPFVRVLSAGAIVRCVSVVEYFLFIFVLLELFAIQRIVRLFYGNGVMLTTFWLSTRDSRQSTNFEPTEKLSADGKKKIR